MRIKNITFSVSTRRGNNKEVNYDSYDLYHDPVNMFAAGFTGETENIIEQSREKILQKT